jgi:hypothetical protein
VAPEGLFTAGETAESGVDGAIGAPPAAPLVAVGPGPGLAVAAAPGDERGA